MKRLIVVALFGAVLCSLVIGVVGCKQSSSVGTVDADKVQQKATEKSMAEAQRQIGMPAIKNFQEKKLAKMIFELRDQEDYVCHAYLVNQINGQVGQYLGKCLGYGLPYSVQFTNPEKAKFVDGGQYGAQNPYTVPQPDPNGLFMPSGLSATWIMLYDEKAEEFRPVYVEPLIIISPFKLGV